MRCDTTSVNCDQVYTRVELTGEDFMSHFKSNFKIQILRETDEDIE